MDVLVGYNGFVGSNLLLSHKFTYNFNSKNIQESYGLRPDLLVYSGVPSSMVLANSEPDKDKNIINDALKNILKIEAKKVVLISTIAVYDHPVNVDEDSCIDETKLSTYGKNRYNLERLVSSEFSNSLIIRLPALYGENLKKNFIYDLLHPIPQLLKIEKYTELSQKNKIIKNYYHKMNDNFYKIDYHSLTSSQKNELYLFLKEIKFSSLSFTDSRSVYQFYNLNNLWKHIQVAIKLNIPVLNISTEPICVSELYKYLTGRNFTNYIMKNPYYYNYKTKYYKDFSGYLGYLKTKKDILIDLKNFYITHGVQ